MKVDKITKNIKSATKLVKALNNLVKALAGLCISCVVLHSAISVLSSIPN